MRSILRLAFPVSLVTSCGGQGEVIDGEGCDYLESGPFTSVTAGLAMDTSAPSITAAGGFTVTLPGAEVGFLSFDSPDDTEYIVFADRPVAVAAFTPSGTEITAQARATSISACTIVQRRDIIELPVGLFYFGLGPDTGMVNVVLRPFNPD